jgi:hypothetical protein
VKSPKQIVPDAEVERVHGSANFGPIAKRTVINEGVLSYAFGYTTGHTMMMILREHGLITKPQGYKASLTSKGKSYLRALFEGVPLQNIVALSRHTQ